MDLLNHNPDIDPVNVRKGNIINEPMDKTLNYVISALNGIVTPLVIMLKDNSLFLNYRQYTYGGIITMVTDLSYNTVTLDKWLNGPNN